LSTGLTAHSYIFNKNVKDDEKEENGNEDDHAEERIG